MTTKEMLKFYERAYNECVNNWSLISEKRLEIDGLSCVIKHFYSALTHSNMSFLFVNGVIIGYVPDFIEYINIFGVEW